MHSKIYEVSQTDAFLELLLEVQVKTFHDLSYLWLSVLSLLIFTSVPQMEKMEVRHVHMSGEMSLVNDCY